MAISQSVLAQLGGVTEKKEPKKHIVTFSHEEWTKLTAAFGGNDEPSFYKGFLLAIADGKVDLSVNQPAEVNG